MTSNGRPVWVIPSVDPGYREACLATLKPAIRDRTVIVDNTTVNRGVAASWNLGIDAAKDASASWLVICSESMRFGSNGGTDWEAQLQGDWTDSLFGWHLVAFRAETLERTGRFDENFWPAYLEDTDYLVRLHLAGYASPRENNRRHYWADIDAHHMGTEHSIREGFVQADLAPGRAYYQQKWGCEQPGYRHTNPFGNPEKDWTWWPPAPGPRGATGG